MFSHPIILESRRLLWRDEADCAALAARLAALPAVRGAFIELRGPLGAGKTSFVRHLLRALGVEGRIKSPSYALLESYSLPGTDVSHFDLYRFDDAREWEDAGFRDIFAEPGLKLVEWPEKAEALLPTADLRLSLTPLGETERALVIDALTACGIALLEAVPDAEPVRQGDSGPAVADAASKGQPAPEASTSLRVAAASAP